MAWQDFEQILKEREAGGAPPPMSSWAPMRQPQEAPPPIVRKTVTRPPAEPTGILQVPKQASKEDLLNEMLTSQKRGIGESEELLKAYLQQTPQVDLSPLAALTDSLVKGSKLSQGYKAPTSAEDRAKLIASLQEKSQGGRQKLAELLQNRKQAQDDLKRREMDLRMLRFGTTFDTKLEDKIRGTLADNIFQEKKDSGFDAAMLDYENMMSNFNRGDYLGFYTGLGSYVRQVMREKGVLSEQDLERASPANINKLVAKADAYFRENPGVTKLPEDFVKPYIDIVERSRQRLSKLKLNQLNSYRNDFSKSSKYGPLMEEGKWGHEKFKQAEDRIKSFGGFSGGSSNSASSEDDQAKQWAKDNPNTPEAAEIRKMFGM